jgi:hypothetical protein
MDIFRLCWCFHQQNFRPIFVRFVGENTNKGDKIFVQFVSPLLVFSPTKANGENTNKGDNAAIFLYIKIIKS